MIQIPDEQWHERCYTSGSTHYTLEEITVAITEYNACEREYNALVAQTVPITKPYDQYPGGIFYAPENIQTLYKQIDSSLIPGISFGTGKESWPVATWRKQIKSYRTLIRKVRSAIDACTNMEVLNG
jgi:hypothetical protein